MNLSCAVFTTVATDIQVQSGDADAADAADKADRSRRRELSKRNNKATFCCCRGSINAQGAIRPFPLHPPHPRPTFPPRWQTSPQARNAHSMIASWLDPPPV